MKKINTDALEKMAKDKNIDKDKILNNVQMDDNDIDIEDNSRFKVLKLTSLCRKLTISLSVVFLCLVCVICISVFNNQEGNVFDDVLTKDFKEYMVECSGVRESNYFSYIKKDEVQIFIYECQNTKDNINYYFYKVKINYDTAQNYLIINNQKIALTNDSYGLLCEIQKDQEITFSIEKVGIITEYKIK